MTVSPTTSARTPGGRRLTPLLVDLSGWDTLVVGGGPIGARRAATLADSGAAVHVVSPEITAAIDDLEGAGRVRISRRRYASDDLDARDLVVAATGDALVDEQIRDESARAGVLCNVAASAERCDVVFPSTIRRGPLVVAVSTAGSSPALAARARDLIGDAIGSEWGDLAELLEEARDGLRDAYPDASGRRGAVDRMMDAGILGVLADGRRDAARAIVRDTIEAA